MSDRYASQLDRHADHMEKCYNGMTALQGDVAANKGFNSALETLVLQTFLSCHLPQPSLTPHTIPRTSAKSLLKDAKQVLLCFS